MYSFSLTKNLINGKMFDVSLRWTTNSAVNHNTSFSAIAVYVKVFWSSRGSTLTLKMKVKIATRKFKLLTYMYLGSIASRRKRNDWLWWCNKIEDIYRVARLSDWRSTRCSKSNYPLVNSYMSTIWFDFINCFFCK